jgi:hypothetical protein
MRRAGLVLYRDFELHGKPTFPAYSTRRIFSSTDHRRRRSGPVNISTRGLLVIVIFKGVRLCLQAMLTVRLKRGPLQAVLSALFYVLPPTTKLRGMEDGDTTSHSAVFSIASPGCEEGAYI